MKPLRLAVSGFTSFRDPLELDFTGLDLFAITGPTGAGKSSLIDAMVFALYGQVPRVGDDYKQLISHGCDRLSVLFEFAVGGERYRIVRAVRRDRPSQQRLERLTASGAEPVTDKAREIRLEVERVLGLVTPVNRPLPPAAGVLHDMLASALPGRWLTPIAATAAPVRTPARSAR